MTLNDKEILALANILYRRDLSSYHAAQRAWNESIKKECDAYLPRAEKLRRRILALAKPDTAEALMLPALLSGISPAALRNLDLQISAEKGKPLPTLPAPPPPARSMGDYADLIRVLHKECSDLEELLRTLQVDPIV